MAGVGRQVRCRRELGGKVGVDCEPVVDMIADDVHSTGQGSEGVFEFRVLESEKAKVCTAYPRSRSPKYYRCSILGGSSHMDGGAETPRHRAAHTDRVRPRHHQAMTSDWVLALPSFFLLSLRRPC